MKRILIPLLVLAMLFVSLAALAEEEAVTLEDVYEPYLVQIGFILRTPRGRVCSKTAYEHLGIPFSDKK